FWDQTGGVATVLGSDTCAVGTVVVGGATAGSVKSINATLDVDMCYQVGIVYGTAMVTGEYTQIWLTLD
ncbi:MAG: hypothetical protein MIO92_12215, partial [Methanosarcinaceae archaeon]|nr:hypothetical protein [Methanosarcinaceae archaeon]